MELPRGSYPSYCYSGDYPTRVYWSCTKCHEVSALNCTAKPKSLAIWACMEVDPLDMPRTPYWASEGNTLNNPPCPITPTLTQSNDLLLPLHYYSFCIILPAFMQSLLFLLRPTSQHTSVCESQTFLLSLFMFSD